MTPGAEDKKAQAEEEGNNVGSAVKDNGGSSTEGNAKEDGGEGTNQEQKL